MNANITREDGRIKVKISYNKTFIAGVKNIGGKWDAVSSIWSVPEENADLLNALLEETVGCNINGDIDMVRVSYDAADFVCGQTIQIGKFIIAERRHRDSRVTLHDDTVIMAGEFDLSGGSAKYPHINAKAGQVTLRSWIPTATYVSLSEEEKSKLTVVEPKQPSTEEQALATPSLNAKDRLGKLRAETGLSPTKFAEAFGIPSETYESWEAEKQTPPEYVITILEMAAKTLKND